MHLLVPALRVIPAHEACPPRQTLLTISAYDTGTSVVVKIARTISLCALQVKVFPLLLRSCYQSCNEKIWVQTQSQTPCTGYIQAVTRHMTSF